MVNDRSTLEILIEQGFKPSRTIVLSLGFDEEIMGAHVRLSFI